MTTLIIASISNHSGKTALAAALAVKLGAEDAPVAIGKAALKDSAVESDVGVFEHLLPGNPSISGAVDDIASNISSTKISIVEGSSDTESNLQLANDTDGLVLLVARYGEEVSNVVDAYGSRLAGVVINAMPKYRTEDAGDGIPQVLREKGINLLGCIPDDRRMLSPKLGQVAEFLEGQLRRPKTRRMRGHTQDLQPPRNVLPENRLLRQVHDWNHGRLW